MERTYKTWGEKANIFCNDTCEVSILRLKPHQRCSWHKHQTKFNKFYVLDGILDIKTEWGTTEVLPGQIFTTGPGEMHEFRTRHLDTLAIEVMYVNYDSDDIDRDMEKWGGPIPKNERVKNAG